MSLNTALSITDEICCETGFPGGRIAVGFGRGNLGTVKPTVVTWRDFVARLTVPSQADVGHDVYLSLSKDEREKLKKRDSFMLPGVCRDGKRDDAHLESRSAATLDIDEHADAVYGALALDCLDIPFAYVWHTTRSHTELAPRLRIVVPFNRPATPDEYRALVPVIAAQFAATIDAASVKPAQMMFLPVQNQGAPFESGSQDGDFADVDALLAAAAAIDASAVAVAAAPPAPVLPPAERRSADLALLESILNAIPQGTPREPSRPIYLKVVLGAHYEWRGSQQAYDIVRPWAELSPTFNEANFDRDWQKAKDNRDGAKATLQTIKDIAASYGWEDPTLGDGFEALPASRRERPRYLRNDKGEIHARLENILTGLRDPLECGVQIRYDTFRAEVMIAAAGTDGWRALTDADYTRLQLQLERVGFRPLSVEMLKSAVWLVADDNQFDSAQLWLRSLCHDGEARIDTFLSRYMGAQDSPYTRAVSRYIWTALAGRVLEPGCEAPMVPVLIGAQGCGKTRSVKALAPAPEFYTELNLADRDSEASRRMRGRLVIELGELRGLHSRDAESIKAFISRTAEEWRALYKEFNTTFARRFLFFGTTNQDEFLDDDSGERRWLPVTVQSCDVEAVQRDCLQLWAEAREAFELVGIDWREAETLARAVHAQHKITDAWVPAIAQWLITPDEFDQGPAPETREFLRVHDVATGALRLDVKALGKREEMRIGKCLQRFGYERALRYDGARRIRVWMKAAGTT
ncbi:hypothetical protein FAZ97_04865 [Paraburkholderia acidiphila]|uniref:Virulence-associated protein E-like domain-containing protein n=2 Tax=Paraburkholderia acidiphila TaxID=2571747 RepID=A0A7Z2G310_9BURK|nr:hypothetical protein FAZ97_04865 [Paraburkholderia acidiphila]